MNAIEKYRARAEAAQSLVCVGLDTEASKIPGRFGGDVAAFNRWIIDQTAPYVSAYKPNIAFYEARGIEGWRDLTDTIQYLRRNYPDILTICDAKRGDMDSTSRHYATAIFDTLGFDSVTMHHYLGKDSMMPFLSRKEKGCIILCRTSNPDAREIQDLQINGEPLWAYIASKAANEWNDHHNVMLVVGATYPDEMRQIRAIIGDDIPMLVPGIGAQGGAVEAVVEAGLDSSGGGLIISASRSVIYADDPASSAQALRDQINRARHHLSVNARL